VAPLEMNAGTCWG